MAAAKVTLKPLTPTAFPPYKWIVYWPGESPGAPRRYRRFKSKSEAEKFRTDKEVRVLNVGRAAAAIDEKAVREAAWALRELEPWQVTLREVVLDYISRRKNSEKSALVKTAVEELLVAKKALGLSERYLADLRAKLRVFAKKHGHRLMSEISPADMGSFLHSLNVSHVTRNGYRRALLVFFSWGEPLGYCQSNPAAKTPEAKEVEKRPDIFTPSQLRLVLRHSPPELIPFLTLAAFAGLRSAEIERLDWSSVDLLRDRITIDAETSKTAAHRFVPICEPLRAWLNEHARNAGPVVPPNLWRRLWNYRKALALPVESGPEARPSVEWKQNALRHSFASYALAREGDAARVALWMGHMSPAMTFKHYRERVTPEEADEWFSVTPEDPHCLLNPLVPLPPGHTGWADSA